MYLLYNEVIKGNEVQKMKLIYGDCGSGKTKEVLKESSEKKIPVLCESMARKDRLIEKAKGYGFTIPTPVVFNEDLSAIKEVLVDDPARLIEEAFGVSLAGISVNVADKNVKKL